MNDKTLVERLRRTHITQSTFGGVAAGAFHSKPVNPDGEEAATRIEALEADNARARAQGQDEGFSAAVQELRDMSARKPLPTLWHAASALADSLEQSRIPCQALEGSGNG